METTKSPTMAEAETLDVPLLKCHGRLDSLGHSRRLNMVGLPPQRPLLPGGSINWASRRLLKQCKEKPRQLHALLMREGAPKHMA